MKWKHGNIDGVIVKPIRKFTDSRGWLAETFRADEISPDIMPVMSYVSVTRPGITRGPHEHTFQTDIFAFTGPGTFRIRMWDNRPESRTFGVMCTIESGESDPSIIMVPPRIVHGYTNISATDGWVLNYPNRLFAGKDKKEPVDEIRHENDPDSEFVM